MSSEIAFDLGNVIFEIDFGAFEKVWNLESGLAWGLMPCDYLGPRPSYDHMFFLEGLHCRQDIDLTTVERSLKELGWLNASSLENLLEAWREVVKPNEGMVKLLEWLKGKGVKVGILSNIGSEHADLIRERWPEVFAGCDLHLSYMVGARKPSKLYYQSFLMENPGYAGCVYVDDLEVNLKAGAKWFNSFRFELSEFKKMGVVEKKKVLCEMIGGIVSVNEDSEILNEFVI